MKTPVVPDLDLTKLPGNIEINGATESSVEQEETKKDQVSRSSYSGIFANLGLPLPRSARVKVDHDILKKDPQLVP